MAKKSFTQEKLAQSLQMSKRQLERMLYIRRHGAPEVNKALSEELLTLGLAEQLVRYFSHEEQVEVVSSGDKKQIREVAAEALAIAKLFNPPAFDSDVMNRMCVRLVNRYGENPEFVNYWRKFLESIDNKECD